MYWTVIGAFVAFEYLAEWLISWLPFYWELKTIFLLFLSLPQTEGSTYIYNAYLQPFLVRNEADLDAGIVRIQRNVLTFVQEKISALWALFVKSSSQSQSSTPASANSQLSWLLSPDAWRSALNVLQPTTNPSPRPQPQHISSTGSHSSLNLEQEPSQKAPAFPVPQHYE
jgi:receptor expression-enhancing protein 1/2/3/4